MKYGKDLPEVLEMLSLFLYQFENAQLKLQKSLDVPQDQDSLVYRQVAVDETIRQLKMMIRDHTEGFHYISDPFSVWNQVAFEEKLVKAIPRSSEAKKALLHLFKVTIPFLSDLQENYKIGISKGIVMAESTVESMIISMKGNTNNRFQELVETQTGSSLSKKDKKIIKKLCRAFSDFASFLKKDLLPFAKNLRPNSKPGLASLGPKGDRLYEHLIERHVTIFDDPIETAALGKTMTAELEEKMLAIAKSAYPAEISDFASLSALLVNRSSSITFLQDFNIEKVKTYLLNQADQIHSVISKEFSNLTVCDFDIKLFESVGSAYYYLGRIDETGDNYCIEKGLYYAGVPSLDPDAIFAYEKDDMSLLMHESVPGHHLQQETMIEEHQMTDIMGEGLQAALSDLESGFAEGWALYSETLGFPLGLYDTVKEPLRVIRHYNNNMLRTIRLWIDSELHLGKLSRDEAVEIMTKRGFSVEYAMEEVDRYVRHPGQALGYIRGRLVIEELRKKALGELPQIPGDFHRRVLRFGTISLERLQRNFES